MRFAWAGGPSGGRSGGFVDEGLVFSPGCGLGRDDAGQRLSEFFRHVDQNARARTNKGERRRFQEPLFALNFAKETLENL